MSIHTRSSRAPLRTYRYAEWDYEGGNPIAAFADEAGAAQLVAELEAANVGPYEQRRVQLERVSTDRGVEYPGVVDSLRIVEVPLIP